MNFKHFEDLWCHAEKLTESSTLEHIEVCVQLKTLLDDYIKLNNIPSMELKRTLKTKKMGEILYRLTELSRIDNINTFAALQMEASCQTTNNDIVEPI